MSEALAATTAERISRHRRGDYAEGRRVAREGIRSLIGQTLRFRARISGSEWAERYGRIPKGTGAESGPVTLYGYQRGLLDAMCDPALPLVTVLKAARVGYTRCFTLAVAYHLHHDPTLCAIAQPTIPDAEDFGGSEIAPMLRETPVLAGLVRPITKGEKQDKATFYQLANGASVRVVGAASDDAFRRYSARFLAADEIDGDGWTPGAKSQGDKLKLFWTRGETFWNRKQVRGSTPLLEDTSRVWKLWLQSDQRRYFVPCPHCGEEQFLEWGDRDSPFGIKFDRDEGGRLTAVWYVGRCGCIIEESHKAWMDARGEWRPTAAPKQPGHVGFHLWTGMSLNPNAAWPVIVQEWLDAQDDPATLVQPFVNLRLGRTYRASYGQEVKAGKFLERAEDYGAEVPAWVRFLTLGGDVQSGVNARIEASVYGWGVGLEAALIGHFVLMGDPAEPGVWQALDLLLKRQFRKADGGVMTVRAAAIDSGGHHTAETYAFCNERHKRKIWAIKGRSEVAGRRGNIWPRKPSGKLGSISYSIGGNAARDWAYGSLAVDKVGARFVHFPHDGAAGSRPVDEEFFAQLTREKRIIVKGHPEWEKAGVREVGVCWVYAYVAVTGLQALSRRFVAMGRAPEEDHEPATVDAQDEVPAAPPILAEPPDVRSITEPPARTAAPRANGWLNQGGRGRRGWLS